MEQEMGRLSDMLGTTRRERVGLVVIALLVAAVLAMAWWVRRDTAPKPTEQQLRAMREFAIEADSARHRDSVATAGKAPIAAKHVSTTGDMKAKNQSTTNRQGSTKPKNSTRQPDRHLEVLEEMPPKQ